MCTKLKKIKLMYSVRIGYATTDLLAEGMFLAL